MALYPLTRISQRWRAHFAPSLPILGAPRTGTNYARALLETNFHVRAMYNSFGWKHGLLPSIAPDATWQLPLRKPLVIVKHPISHIASLYDYLRAAGHNLKSSGKNMQQFLMGRIICHCERAALRSEIRFANPAQLWNTVVWNHLHYAKAVGGLVIRYEDLLMKPEPTCKQIARHFRLKQHSTAFIATQDVARRMSDKDSLRPHKYTTDSKFDKGDYFLRAGVERYTSEQLKWLHQQLDTDLLTHLGYEINTRTPISKYASSFGIAAADESQFGIVNRRSRATASTDTYQVGPERSFDN